MTAWIICGLLYVLGTYPARVTAWQFAGELKPTPTARQRRWAVNLFGIMWPLAALWMMYGEAQGAWKR